MEVTQLLKAAGSGDKSALEQLAPLVYDELRKLAHSQLRGEAQPRTLSTTGLVHEAYLKLAGSPNLPTENRGQFFAIAARVMRQIMISEARRRGAAKRGGGALHLTLESSVVSVDELSSELVSLNDALDRLEGSNDRLARIVECRFFAGLSVEETAEAIEVSTRTVKRDWRIARAWLYRELNMPHPQARPG